MTYFTTSSGSSASGLCTAHLTINRNRVKEYSAQTVYLKDGSTFEIELHNSKQISVLAKIYFNGQPISDKGIVLRPGERIYLERYIDQNKKFLFSTYEVDNTSENKKSIEKNGEVKVEFYHEQTPSSLNIGSFQIYNSPYYVQPWCYGNLVGTGTANTSFYNANSNFTSSISNMQPISGSIETGRVETGESSNQRLDLTNGIYNTLASSWTIIKILPESAKPIEVSQIRNYCSSCGTRIKKSSWSFCPTCGSKFE
jgi:hypothetical protein